MRTHIANGTDLQVDARFADMLLPRHAQVLDVGCGTGSAVNALRQNGHAAFGIDPTGIVLQIASETFDPQWFRHLGAEQVSHSVLAASGLPTVYDLMLMTGNVPAFLAKENLLVETFQRVASCLTPGGVLLTGTSSHADGGPRDQDEAARDAGLTPRQRFADWHATPHHPRSPWSVSVYDHSGARPEPRGPDGMFILT